VACHKIKLAKQKEKNKTACVRLKVTDTSIFKGLRINMKCFPFFMRSLDRFGRRCFEMCYSKKRKGVIIYK
jgi:hypothetical protein